MDDQLCLQGILYVLFNDIAWQLLPLELRFGSTRTCWRRLDRWQQAGVFDQPHRFLLVELHAADALDWTGACVDGSHVRAKGGAATGLSPVDRRKLLADTVTLVENPPTRSFVVPQERPTRGQHLVEVGKRSLHGVWWLGVVHRPAPLACRLWGPG